MPVPTSMRIQLGLHSGSKVEVVLVAGHIEIHPKDVEVTVARLADGPLPPGIYRCAAANRRVGTGPRPRGPRGLIVIAALNVYSRVSTATTHPAVRARGGARAPTVDLAWPAR